MSVREAIVRHWPLKLAALALSVILWVVVALEEPATHLEDVRLELSLAPTAALAQPLPPVQALIAGPRGEFLKLGVSALVIRATIPDSAAGSHHRLAISPGDVELPRNVKVSVQEVLPREVDVVLDRRAQRTVPVAVRAVVEPESGYALDGPVTAVPAAVRVSGAISVLGGLDSIATEALQLKGVTGVFARTVALDTTGHAVLQIAPLAVTLSGKTKKT
ncbi:MAG TPA: YbbR-like domain-containing protein [Gemmatimonadales bacterium]|nr:YbbR-like domain-containing protein [Gemmatimonadales bacterium]